MKKLSIILSFYNEEETLEYSLNTLSNEMSKLSSFLEYEIICVNDASTDNSYKILLEKRKINKKIKIINLSRRFGHMPGIMAGLRNCTGDAALYLDIDLQDPPHLIADMVDAWMNENYEVVFTTRKMRHGESVVKKIVSKIGYKILQRTTYINIEPDSGDFKLISRRVINEIIKFKEINPFYRFLIDYIGFKKKQIFYERETRNKGKTKFPLGRKVFDQFFEISLIPFSDSPLKLIFLIGITATLFIFPLTFYYILKYIFFHREVGVLTNILILFLLNINLLGLGFFALYLSAIFKEVKKRPVYIIDERIGFD
jgi:glycosyltransferase involved in cell wall biosynthesis